MFEDEDTSKRTKSLLNKKKKKIFVHWRIKIKKWKKVLVQETIEIIILIVANTFVSLFTMVTHIYKGSVQMSI